MNRQNIAYEVVLADTEEGKKIHFRLRYQVYCIDKEYEDAKKFQDGMEQDEHDVHAIHFLIRHKTSKQWVGAFRLIIESLHKLPAFQHVKISIPHILKPQHKFAEFSRLSVLRQFQKLPGKKTQDINDRDIVFKAISVGIEYSRKHDVRAIIFFCRRSLAKLVNKMGIKTYQVGTKTFFRGTRYPYKLDLTNIPTSLFETPKALQAFRHNTAFSLYSQTTSLVTQAIVGSVGKYFNIVEANTPVLIEQAFRLRHYAYGIDMPFEPLKSPSGAMAMDEYDKRSEYSLIQHRTTGSYAATTRLILPDSDNPKQPFPIERHCQIERTDMLQSLLRPHLAEVSRFCVSNNFKRRQGEQETVSGVSGQHAQDAVFGDGVRREFPHIILVLIACLLRVTTRHGITHWYALMEPAVIMLLKRLGVNSTPIGPTTYYHGLCVPCIIEVQSLLADSGQFSQICRKLLVSA